MRILVTGGSGLVGTALTRVNKENDLISVSSKQFDLTNLSDAERMIKSTAPDCIIHLAARVGGINANMTKPADFFYQNIMINTNVLHSAFNYNVKKVVSMLSTCIFPNNVKYPLEEEDIHAGEPHDSNFAYSYAKRMLDVQSRAYRAQYGCNFVTAVPNNLFGKNDNFDLEDSHVIPAMIRKFHDAVASKSKKVTLWGNGKALREFTYSDDIARQLLFVAEKYNDPNPINLGTSQEVSIRKLAEIIADASGFAGDIEWDENMPTGQLRKPSDKSKIKALGWDMGSFTDLSRGISETCSWYKNSYPNIRGVN